MSRCTTCEKAQFRFLSLPASTPRQQSLCSRRVLIAAGPGAAMIHVLKKSRSSLQEVDFTPLVESASASARLIEGRLHNVLCKGSTVLDQIARNLTDSMSNVIL